MDSLNRINVPLSFDTVLFNSRVKENGRREFDTVMPNGMTIAMQSVDDMFYRSIIRHSDSLIKNVYKYDIIDGKLLMWYKTFTHSNSPVDYVVKYNRGGRVKSFFFPEYGETWDSNSESETGISLPEFSIYDLIGVLKKEDVDLFKGVEINYSAYYNKIDSSILIFVAYCWVVHIDKPDTNDLYEYIFDARSGRLLDDQLIEID